LVKDAPVEDLHVVLLGAVKYLFQDFMKGLNEEKKKSLSVVVFLQHKLVKHPFH
jgi:hypothetical protein